MNLIDLSNPNDVVKSLDQTSSNTFLVGSEVDWGIENAAMSILFGTNTSAPENVPSFVIGIDGKIQMKNKDGEYEDLGSVQGSNHSQNTDTGTSSSSFIVQSQTQCNAVSMSAQLLFGAVDGSYSVGIRNNAGRIEARNHEEDWFEIGTGSGGSGGLLTGTTNSSFNIDSDGDSSMATQSLIFGIGTNVMIRNIAGELYFKDYAGSLTKFSSFGTGHTQNTDTGTSGSSFRINVGTSSNSTTQTVLFGDGINTYETGVRNNSGTMQFKNYSGSWTDIGSGSGGGGITHTVITANQSAVINSGYIANGSSQLSVTLPATAAVGSIISIVGLGAGGWKIVQGASQQIHMGSVSSSAGAGGYAQSTYQRDCIEIICVVANNEWQVKSSIGEIELV